MRSLKSAALLVVMLDGIISTILGHRFIAWWQSVLPPPLKPLSAFFLKIPEPLFRIGALAQGGAAAYLLGTLLIPRCPAGEYRSADPKGYVPSRPKCGTQPVERPLGKADAV